MRNSAGRLEALRTVGLVTLVILMGCAPSPQPSSSSPGAVAGAATAPQASAPAAPKRIQAIIMGNPTQLSTALNPPGGAGSVPGLDSLEMLIHAGLSTVDNQGALRPQLAETVPSLENGQWKLFPDGRMETTWKIRRGAIWHDGTPFTSDDLLFTARVGMENQIPLFNNVAYAFVESVEAPDPSTVLVKWKRPYVEADTLFTRLRGMPLPKHLLEQPYAEDRLAFPDLPYWNEKFVGAGPFKVRQWVNGSHMIVEAVDGYVLGRPKIDSIEIKFVPDANTLIVNVLANAAELTLGARISVTEAIQARDQWREGKVDFAPTGWLNIYPQFINPDPPVMLDVRFRRAMLYAIDRQQIHEAIMAGLTSVHDSPIGPHQAEYKEIESAIVRYEYDPRKTAQLLTELGYFRAADGFYRDVSGQQLRVENRATAQLDYQPKGMAAVSDYWQQAGVMVDQVVVPNQRVPDREYRQTRPGFEVLNIGNDPTSFSFFHSSKVPLPSNNFVGLNRSRYTNPELDGLIDRYDQTIPRAERMGILRGIIHHLSDQLVFMGLCYTTSHTMIGNRLRNVTGRGPNSPEGWNAHEWDAQ